MLKTLYYQVKRELQVYGVEIISISKFNLFHFL